VASARIVDAPGDATSMKPAPLRRIGAWGLGTSPRRSLCGDDHRFVDPDDDDRVSVTTEPDAVPADLGPFLRLDGAPPPAAVDAQAIAGSVNPTFGETFHPPNQKA